MKDIITRAETADYLLIGEQHTSASHHKTQASIIKALAMAQKHPAIGLEMVPATKQPVLDQFNARKLTVEELPVLLDWKTIWGFDFALYKPIFEVAEAYNIPVYGLNISQEVVQSIREKASPSAIPHHLALTLPPIIQYPQAVQQEKLTRFFSGHAAMLMGKKKQPKIFPTSPASRPPMPIGSALTRPPQVPSTQTGSALTHFRQEGATLTGSSQTDSTPPHSTPVSPAPNHSTAASFTPNTPTPTGTILTDSTPPHSIPPSATTPLSTTLTSPTSTGLNQINPAPVSPTKGAQKPGAKHGQQALKRFLLIQSLWDSTMGYTATHIPHEGIFVILAGGAHVEFGYGIAHRIHHYEPQASCVLIMPLRKTQRTQPEQADFYFMAMPE